MEFSGRAPNRMGNPHPTPLGTLYWGGDKTGLSNPEFPIQAYPNAKIPSPTAREPIPHQIGVSLGNPFDLFGPHFCVPIRHFSCFQIE